MKNKQFSILNNGGGGDKRHLCITYKKVIAMISSLAILSTSAPFLPYSNFSLSGGITANAEEECKHENMEFMEGREPTCEEKGWVSYWHCYDCHSDFSDENGINEIGEEEAEKLIIAPTGHNLSGEYAYGRGGHWEICLNNCNEIEKEEHNLVDGKCSVCNFETDAKFVINNTINFSVADYSGNWDENATLGKNGYEWNAKTKTLILGDIYIRGDLILPYDGGLNTIVIADGANPVIAWDITFSLSTSLTVKGNGTLTAGFSNWNTDSDDVLTITGGAEVITNYMMWPTNGGIAITDGGKLNVSEYIFTEKITMDDTAEFETDINLSIGGYGNVDNGFAGLKDYIPLGYKMEELKEKDAEGNMTTYGVLFIPQDATVVFNKSKLLYEVYDKDGNLITGRVKMQYSPYADRVGERLEGHSISLDGNIGVNFYMELDESVIADKDAYMKFILPNGKIATVKVGEAKKDTIKGKTYYVFSCSVAAKEVYDIITAQIITSNGNGTVYKYSVADYADYILKNPDNYDAETVNLVNAMMTYGKYAKSYFSSSIIGSDSDLDKVTAETLKKFEKQTNGTLPDGIKYYGSSLLLESNTTIRHYFKVAKGTDVSKYNFTGQKSGYYYKDITNISAGKLGTPQITKIGDWSISYSPMSYVYSVLESDSTDENLKKLCKALYLYQKAAEAYKNK